MMAASGGSNKVKDSKYINWLKVTLALSHLKNGIHSFIESEVRSMHKNLLRIIYEGKEPRECTNCYSRDIRWNGRNWEFPSCCNLDCGKWLLELQKLFSSHINPDQIFWTNSSVQEWPLKPWECAKIFLPQGQLPSNIGPCVSDSQALMTLLSLMTNCQHFSNKLSKQRQSLAYDIAEIQNNVMHSAAMEVSDADRTTYIQLFIDFLHDPVFKSLEECKTAVAEVRKIKNSSLDSDLEVTALNACINEMRLELGMEAKKTEDTIESLKEEYKKLRELLIKRLEDFEKELKLQGTRMDTIESNIQEQENKQKELDTTVALHKVRLDLVEENVQNFDTKLQELETNADIALQQQEKKHQEMDTTVTQLSESMETMSLNIASCEGRLVVYEENVQLIGTKLQELENNSGIERKVAEGTSDNGTSEKIDFIYQRAPQVHEARNRAKSIQGKLSKPAEAPASRRTESDGLRQLKNQTEDNLDTFRKMGFIPTTQTEQAMKLLQEKRSVVIKGKTGEGKSSTALYLIDDDEYKNQRVVVHSPGEWKKVDTDWVKIVVLEDIFGQYDLDHGCLQEWIDDCLQTTQKHVDVGKLQVIVTIRDDILLKAYSKLKSFRLFFSDMSLTLSSDKLEHSDKMSILNRELERNNKDMNVDEKVQCIFANYGGSIGFPQCCSLFAKFKNLFDQGPKFFESPEKCLVENITNLHLKDNSFLSLAFLFCNGEIEEEYLSPSQINKSKKYLPVLEELARYLNISFNESTVISLRQSYDHFSGLYVDKVCSYKPHSEGNVTKCCIQFSHATVREAVGQVLGDTCPEMVVKYGDSGFLYQRTYTAESKDETSLNVYIPVAVYELLVERMVDDVVEKHLVGSVVNHSALKQHRFLVKLKDELHKGNRTEDFLMPIKAYAQMPNWFYSDHKELSEGVCMTFLQYILQRDKDVVRLVYSEFLEFLACTHNNNSSECWQCKEKQRLLELALYYHHFEIVDKLIIMNACYTHVSLCNAARHGGISRVQTILEYLKRSLVFNPECNEAKKALCRAFISGNQEVIEILLQVGITLDRKHVVYVVQHGDIHALMKVVEHLKCHNKWDPHREQYSTPTILFHPVLYSDIYLDTFKDDFDLTRLDQMPCCIALYITYYNGKFDMADYLVKHEARVSLDLIDNVSRFSSQEAVARVIQHLKVSGILDSDCANSSEALVTAYTRMDYNMCDLLIQEGVSLTMKNLPDIAMRINHLSSKPLKKALKHLKDNESWDPKCDDASTALDTAYRRRMYDVCDILVQEGVSLTMKHIPNMIWRSLDYLKTAVKQLQDTDRWDPKCDDASEALEKAYREKRYDVCDLLVQEGVSLTMKLMHHVILGSLDYVKTAVKHLKDTDSWDPKCDAAFEALRTAYLEQKYDVYDLLIQEGVPLTLKSATNIFRVKKVIQQLKDTDRWDPKDDDASKALEEAYTRRKYDICDLLVQEGVSLTMKTVPHMIWRSLDDVKTAVKQLKDANNWNPNCDDASRALGMSYYLHKHDMCDLLIQEGVPLTMKNLINATGKSKAALETVKKVIQQLKDADIWDPNCDDASEAIGRAYGTQKYDVCDLLIQEGVSLTMKSLTSAVSTYQASLDSVLTIIQKLKAINSWNPRCEEGLKALKKAEEVAYSTRKYDVAFLLLQLMTSQQ